MKEEKIPCRIIRYREFPDLLFGTLREDGPVYFDATRFIQAKGDARRHNVRDFRVAFHHWATALADAYGIDREKMIIRDEASGHLLIDECLALLFVVYIDPAFGVYLLERVDELLENGAIARVCPTALKISFRKNGREQWGFRPIDMRRLLQLVRKETIIPRDLLDELEVWGNKLLELEAGELHAVPQDDIVMHFEEGFPVTFRRVGDKLMVNATQITMHFGKIPSEWLRIASTDMLRREMAGNGHTGKYESQVFTTRGRGHGATWLESPLVIPLARWIAPDLSLAEWLGEAIGKLSVKRGKTIVRERPRVAAPGLPCMDCPMPQDMESATRLILELRKVVSESLPKIVFYEEFIENRDWFKSTRIADELGISPRQLHQFLAEEGICKYEKRQWVVFPSCRAWQCDVPYTWENSRGKVYTFGSTKRWTQAGRECIIELWRKRNPEYCPPGA